MKKQVTDFCHHMGWVLKLVTNFVASLSVAEETDEEEEEEEWEEGAQGMLKEIHNRTCTYCTCNTSCNRIQPSLKCPVQTYQSTCMWSAETD